MPMQVAFPALEPSSTILSSSHDHEQNPVVIHEIDNALRALVQREIGTRDVEIAFDAPTRDWAARRSAPTINVYLYDIREDMRRRTVGMVHRHDEQARVIGREAPPRFYKLSYLVTAWTQRPEDEHRLLSALLSCFIAFDSIPDDLLTGRLGGLSEPLPMTIALPPPQDRAFADVWSALGGELKPSLDLVTTVPMITGQGYETGPPVTEPLELKVSGKDEKWPPAEVVRGRADSGTASADLPHGAGPSA